MGQLDSSGFINTVGDISEDKLGTVVHKNVHASGCFYVKPMPAKFEMKL